MNLLHLSIRFTIALASRFSNLYFTLLGTRITGYAWLPKIFIPRQWSDITIEGSVALDFGVTLVCSGPPLANKILIRRGTYINRNSILDAHRSLEIGCNCLIGPGCFITDSNHNTIGRLSPMIQAFKSSPTLIEDDVWIGANSVVLAGVRIGKGAVIGAGSVVTKNVLPYHVVAGVPAKVLYIRDTISSL
ncbi:MAG: acyltransferase [Balneolales bacterium]